MQGFKIVSADHTHYGFKYQEGLNIDPNPFSAEGSCVAGGLYFFTDIIDVYKWLDYGVYLYQVHVPEDYQYVQDPNKGKYRASALYLSNPLDLREASTWEYLAEQGVDIYADDEALLWAAHNGHLEVVKYCTSQGADIHAGDDLVLRWAARRGHIEVVKYLVENGADIHAVDDYALRWSASYGHLEIVKYLVSKGADIHAEGEFALRNAAEKGHLKVVKFLVERGADIHAMDDYTLRWAAQRGHLDVVKFLVEQGADTHASQDEALHRAAYNGHLEVVKFLVENGAYIHALKGGALDWSKNNFLINTYLKNCLQNN